MTSTLRPSLVAPLTATGNLLVGAGALALAAVAWNPLPVILFGLAQPLRLYRALTAPRDPTAERAARRAAARRTQGGLARQLATLVATAPCAGWIARGLLPDYPAGFRHLVALRDDAARLVAARDDAAAALEDDLIDGLDALLAGYLTMARERLRFHCALAGAYPALPAADDDDDLDPVAVLTTARAAGPATATTPLPTVDAEVRAITARADGLVAAHAAGHDPDDVYPRLLATLHQRRDELVARGRRDQAMAAQLAVLPDEFALVHDKLAAASADLGAVVTDMAVLVEQTDDTVRFTAEARRGGP